MSDEPGYDSNGELIINHPEQHDQPQSQEPYYPNKLFALVDENADLQTMVTNLKTQLEQAKAERHSWAVAKEIEMGASFDKDWNRLVDENTRMRTALEKINVSDDAIAGNWVTEYELRAIAREALQALSEEKL